MTRSSLGTQELMALTDEELAKLLPAEVTPATWRRVAIERDVRAAIKRAVAKAGLL